jgi:hypothetical protein
MSTGTTELTTPWARPVPSWIVAVRPGDEGSIARIDHDPNGFPEIASAESCTVALDGYLFNADELRRGLPQASSEESDAPPPRLSGVGRAVRRRRQRALRAHRLGR